MAMSLEDLLSKEGFKRRKAKMKPRTSSASEGRSVPLYLQEDKHETGSLMAVRRAERTRSDIPRNHSKGEFSTSSSFTGNMPRDILCSKGEIREKRNTLDYERRGHRDSLDANKRLFSIGSSNDLLDSEISQSDEIIEVGMNRSYKDIYSNKAYSHNGHEGKFSARNEIHRDNIVMDNNKKDKKNNSFKRTNFGESRSIKQEKLEEVVGTPALDEVAIKAIISILSGYAKRFVEDEDFRTSLHHNTFASLNLSGLYKGLNTESCKVIENLEQAIEIVERAAEERATLKELKKASLQLSVITGLNSNDLKDGFTSGIPNAKLSACSHLYLSIVYVLQKKDGIAAKHLLQVFCNSPFQARTTLLPDLWDHVFLPHLLHLKVWYDKEIHSLENSPISMNLKLLEKVYNQSLDSGTYQIAMYYKDWMMDGVEAPSVPLIRIPSFSVHVMPRGGLLGHTSSPASHVSPQPMVSKVLYDEVFRHSHKAGVDLEENFDSSAARSSNSPATEDKQLILYTHDSVTQTNKTTEESPSDNIPVREDKVLSEPKQSEDSINNVALKETRTEPSVLEVQKKYEYLFSIPQDFVCPLTGLLFKDPVTLETGQTFEREAIMDWFGKGCRSCPVSKRELQCQTVPRTNLILKRVIDKWKTDHIEHLLFEIAAGSNEIMEGNGNKFICTLGKLLPLCREDEREANVRRLISLGGLQFLVRRFSSVNTQEKTFILALLCCCIEADAGCRNDIARNLNLSNLLQLLRNEQQLKLRSNAVSLLIELICFNRRSRAKSFLEGLLDEEIINALDHLNMYLRTCPLEQTPLVAVLILHLDLLSERGSSDIYREEAVDALTVGLRRSLSDEEVQNKCCRALLILGGFFSSSGKLMTEDWILKLAGFLNGPEPDGDFADDECNDIAAYGTMETVDSVNEEETVREKWLVRLSASLIGDGKKSFVDAVSKCLSLGNSDLVRVCLITVAWLSFSLASLHDTKFQICALSALISPLKQCLEYGEFIEHKILASFSLLNFAKIPECRIMLLKIGYEVASCLDNLSEVTWTARELHAIISG